jgi:amino acid transporter
MVAFAVMSSGVTSAATAAKAFGDTYLRQFVTLPTWAVATVFVLDLALINFRGVGESVKANVVLTCIELSGLLLIIGVGIYTVSAGRGDASRLTQIDTGDSGAFLAITAATSLAFVAMVGFEDSVNMGEGSATRRSGSSRARCCSAWPLPRQSTSRWRCCRPCWSPPACSPTRAATPCSGCSTPARPASRSRCSRLSALRGGQLRPDQHAHGQPPALRHGQRADHSPAVLPGARESAHAVGGHRFTSAVAIVLVVTADISLLGGTTALLLLAVFTIVNVAVLVLRRDHVDHPHFRAPTWAPYAGIVLSGFLATPLSGRPLQQFVVAGILLAVGAVLWVVNRIVVGRVDVDPEHLAKG